MGVSVGNPLSLMPELGVYNKQGQFLNPRIYHVFVLMDTSLRYHRLGGIPSRDSWLKDYGTTD